MISNSMKEDMKNIKNKMSNSLNIKAASNKNDKKTKSSSVQASENINNNTITPEVKKTNVISETKEEVFAAEERNGTGENKNSPINVVENRQNIENINPQDLIENPKEEIIKDNNIKTESNDIHEINQNTLREDNQGVIEKNVIEEEKIQSIEPAAEPIIEDKFAKNIENINPQDLIENPKEEIIKDNNIKTESSGNYEIGQNLLTENNIKLSEKKEKGFDFKMREGDENKKGIIDPEINKELKEVVAKKEEDKKKIKNEKIVKSENTEKDKGIKKVKKSSRLKIFAALFFFLFIILAVAYFVYSLENKDNISDNNQNIITEENSQEVVEEVVFEEENPESEFIEEEFIEEETEEEISLKNDEERMMNLDYLSHFLIAYCIEENIDFPISENYTKLNEENSVSDFMKKIPFDGEEKFTLIDPKDPEFYYAYKSLDGKSFEFTARMENYHEEDCKESALENEGVCVVGLYMDEEFISKVKEIGE